MSNEFEKLGMRESLIAGLLKAGITLPTPVQAAVIPDILKGRDVIGQSATGTGKTLAYLLPLFQKIDATKQEMQAIILAPTHELVMQIFHEAETLAQNSGEPVSAATIIGEANVSRQIDKLKKKPHLIIGSSGRILDLIKKHKINAQTVKTIVLDEADRLLDDNNRESVTAVIRSTQKDRQLLLFSATITPSAMERAGEWTREPLIALVRGEAAVPPTISHMYFMTETRDKIDLLRKLLASIQPERVLVFVNTAPAIAETVAKLNYHGVTAAGLHGSSAKAARQAALDDYRTGRVRVLVASDLAARGLDLAGIDSVVNLDLPETSQAYLHRAGRTGRAGKSGRVFSIVDRAAARRIPLLQKSLQIKIVEKKLSYGKIIEGTKPAVPFPQG